MSAHQYNNAGGYEQYQQAPQSGYDQAYGGQGHYGQQQHDPYGKASNYTYAPEEQKVQGRQVIITYDDDDEVVKQGKKRFNVDERHFVEKNIQEDHHGKKHFRVESNFNRTEVQLPKGKRQVQGARGNQSNFMGAISRDHLDGRFEKPPNKPKRKTPRPVLLPGESIRHNPTHNSAEQTFHFSKQGDTARWKADLPKKDLQQIKAEKRRLNVAPGEAPSYQPTFNSNISSFQDAISRDDFDGKAEMPQKEIYLRQGKNSKPSNVRPGEALRYQAKSHAHHNNPLGHMDSKEWARELPTKNNTKQVFEPKFPPPRRAHQFSVQLGSDQPNYPKGKYLDQRGKINGKDPKEYTSLRYPVTHSRNQQMDPSLLADGVTPYSIAEIQQQQNQDGSVVGYGVQRTPSRSSLGAAGYNMMSNSQGGYTDQQGFAGGQPAGQEKNFNYGMYNINNDINNNTAPTAHAYGSRAGGQGSHYYHAPPGTDIQY